MSFKKHDYVRRCLEADLDKSLRQVPVTAVLGPRQCGKSTLVTHLLGDRKDVVYLDLERPSHLRRLDDPELFLSQQRGKLVCLDEVQRKPNIFSVVRSMVDDKALNLKMLLLGSASPELLKQSSESLAGRIRYLTLTPFQWGEVRNLKGADASSLFTHWRRGGFPGSFLAESEEASILWREQFVRTFLEQDIPMHGGVAYAETFARLWRMSAHVHGQLLNSSRLGESLGLSHVTVRNWLGLLESTFMLRLLPPLHENLKKRLIKTPKLYFRDSGLLHTLLEIESQDALLGNPVVGASWEGWCVEQIVEAMPRWRASFYRDSNDQEIDLVMEHGRQRMAFEFKLSLSPQLTRGSRAALGLIKPEKSYLVCPMTEKGFMSPGNVYVCGMSELLDALGSGKGRIQTIVEE